MNTVNAGAVARPASGDKVSNGSRLLPAGVDMRSARGRRLKFLVRSFHEALGAGDITELELGQLRQLAILTIQAETIGAAVVRGEDVDGDQLIRLNSEARRIQQALGFRAEKDKPAGPNLQEYLDTTYPASNAVPD